MSCINESSAKNNVLSGPKNAQIPANSAMGTNPKNAVIAVLEGLIPNVRESAMPLFKAKNSITVQDSATAITLQN